jgi:hypothetical protein
MPDANRVEATSKTGGRLAIEIMEAILTRAKESRKLSIACDADTQKLDRLYKQMIDDVEYVRQFASFNESAGRDDLARKQRNFAETLSGAVLGSMLSFAEFNLELCEQLAEKYFQKVKLVSALVDSPNADYRQRAEVGIDKLRKR